LLAGALWSVPTGVLASLFAVMATTFGSRSYGWVLFVMVPFLSGFQATLALSRSRRIYLRDAIMVSCLAVVLLGGLMLAAAVEGVICLVMATPLALILAMLGGGMGLWVSRWEKISSSFTCLLIAGLVPFGSTVEHVLSPPASVFEVTTSIDLSASPELVWQTVLQPAKLLPPTHALLRAGIGYPRESHIEGTGPTAIRYCDFSTGKLIEPVLIWKEPLLLRFTVAANPIPMEEWTPTPSFIRPI
jgi:hypothetical protein